MKNEASFCKTLNGRLPPEDGSVRPQTLGKRVSDDSQHFIFRRRKKKLAKIFDKNFRRKKIRCRKRNVGNRLKRVLAKFHADGSYP